MVEFRTRALGADEESSSSLEEHLERVYDNIRSDPELKKRLMQEASENDIDPVLLRAVFGNDMPSEDELKQDMTPPQAEEAAGETQVVTKTPDPEQLIGFLEEIMDLTPNDMTLSELREWAEDNRDIVETAIDMRF